MSKDMGDCILTFLFNIMITYEKRKKLSIVYSGRSSDYLPPAIVMGCQFDCSYCYLKRHHPTKDLSVATNIGNILTEINNHAFFDTIEKPNQVDDKFVVYDIGCNSDISLDSKYWDWKYVFNFFKEHPKAKATFATKYVNDKFLEFNPERKVRIRFSLMPQTMSLLMEPNTSSIETRIKAINTFVEAGYDVHINFSPVIYYNNWEMEYKELFELVNNNVNDSYKKDIKSEVIMLTHNEDKHNENMKNCPAAESILWQPEIQESKISQSYNSSNIKYINEHKSHMIYKFKQIHNGIIPWNEIRYIF